MQNRCERVGVQVRNNSSRKDGDVVGGAHEGREGCGGENSSFTDDGGVDTDTR